MGKQDSSDSNVHAPRATGGKLAGLKQNLLAEKMALEEKMQQLQRRLEAIQVLLEEENH